MELPIDRLDAVSIYQKATSEELVEHLTDRGGRVTVRRLLELDF